MSTPFQVDEEIDKLVDKFAEDLKIRIKKIVVKSEKIMLKQYIASQRETSKAKKDKDRSDHKDRSDRKDKDRSDKDKDRKEPVQKSPRFLKKAVARPAPKREQDYASASDSEDD